MVGATTSHLLVSQKKIRDNTKNDNERMFHTQFNSSTVYCIA